MIKVVAVISKDVNFSRSKAMNHHQFKDFLREMES
jgi:hypothetical protein